ncbi:MAG: ATPase [Gammaproteobacteria bacterium]|jgi:tRNA threonylcarbamoyladenosine biosynthesis protein TsaE|nr:ATPase [Gammaproteobacteria bacterium]
MFLPDLQSTLKAAQEIAETIHAGQVVYLHGELGAGKTSFVQGLLRAWGYHGAVKSPTYTLVEPYEFSQFTVYHFDLYRLKDPAELGFMGVEEYFSPESICLIEWPERAEGYLPKADCIIELSYDGEGRDLKFVKSS